MPEILSTSGSSHKIEKIISDAKQHIVIVTPYLKITNSILSRLQKANRDKVKINLLFRENELSETMSNELRKMDNLNLYSLPRLHAKCYLNENHCLISSMNLYESSQINNWEIGVFLDEKEETLKDQIHTEIDYMFENATNVLENFERPALLQKRFMESLSEYLNARFQTERFSYFCDPTHSHGRYEDVQAHKYRLMFLKIRINQDGRRTDFFLELPQKRIDRLKGEICFSSLEQDYRVYFNSRDTISMYDSEMHRDHWSSYKDEFKFDYIAKGIESILSSIEKIESPISQ